MYRIQDEVQARIAATYHIWSNIGMNTMNPKYFDFRIKNISRHLDTSLLHRPKNT
jgi:hypothetical protein